MEAKNPPADSDFAHISNEELRHMFANPNADRTSSEGKKNGLNRKLTLDELLTSPLSNIFEVRVGQANVLRSAGNEVFKKGDYAVAIKLYERALKHCAMDEDRMSAQTHKLREKMYEGRDPIYLNLARCYFKEKRFRDCVNSAKGVSRTEGDDAFPVPPALELKALVLASSGYTELGEYTEAEASLDRAQERLESVCLMQASEAQEKVELGKILAGAQAMRQSIKARAALDRRKQRDTWRGALWGPVSSINTTGSSSGDNEKSVGGEARTQTNVLLDVISGKPLLALSLIILALAVLGAILS